MPRVLEEIPRKEKQVVCENCGRTIAFVPNEVKKSNWSDYGGGPAGRQYIICPANDCNGMIVLKTW